MPHPMPAQNQTDVAILLFNLTTGGVERVAVHVANGLARRGMKVELVLVRKDGPLNSLIDPLVRLHVLFPELEGGKKGRQIIKAIPALRRYLRQTHPKIVFASGVHLIGYAYLAFRLAREPGQKLVLKLATNIFTTSKALPARLVKYVLCALAMRASSLILTIGPDGDKEAEKLLGRADVRIQRVHNPYVDIKADQPLIRRSNAPRHFLCVGRLTAQKDYPTLFRALSGLLDLEWELRILGDGEDRDALERLALDLGIKERIRFEGFVIDPQPFYEQADLFLLSSRYEGLPAVILEAMAHGIPIVATASTQGITDMLKDGRFGLLCPVGQPQDLALTIRKAMTTKFNCEAAQAHAQLYSLENGVEDHYISLLPLLGS